MGYFQVCSVQPGQMLALRTTIGLMAAVEELKQRGQEAADPPLPSKGTLLKTGRLQPLCRVVTPPQEVDQCLGIVPGKCDQCADCSYLLICSPTSIISMHDLPCSDDTAPRWRKTAVIHGRPG